MQAQITDPDELENDIIKEFKSSFNDIPLLNNGGWRQQQWTENIKNAVGRLLEQRGYTVYASNCGGEFLYDLTGIEEKGDYINSIPLILESEWLQEGQLHDFRKLIVSRADHRVMVFEVGHNEEKEDIVKPFLQHVRNCRHSMVGDRYLFAWWKRSMNRWIFDYSVYEVIEE